MIWPQIGCSVVFLSLVYPMLLWIVPSVFSNVYLIRLMCYTNININRRMIPFIDCLLYGVQLQWNILEFSSVFGIHNLPITTVVTINYPQCNSSLKKIQLCLRSAGSWRDRLYLQLPMQSVYITTNVVSSYPGQARCTRYNIMWYSLSGIVASRWFSPGTPVSSVNKLTATI